MEAGARNVKTHDMPPEDADKQPTEAERQTFMDWVGMIKFLSPKDPGPFVIRRLTKAEYGNTLHDLFGVDPAVAAELPDEVAGQGYLNTLSPLQTEQYLAIANDGAGSRFWPPTRRPPTELQQQLIRQTASARRRCARRREESRPLPGPQRLSPAGDGGGNRVAAESLRPGAGKQTLLPGVRCA